jgi:hypothetical protein
MTYYGQIISDLHEHEVIDKDFGRVQRSITASIPLEAKVKSIIIKSIREEKNEQK